MNFKRLCALLMVFFLFCCAPATAENFWGNVFDTIAGSDAFNGSPIPSNPAATPEVTASAMPSEAPAPEYSPSPSPAETQDPVNSASPSETPAPEFTPSPTAAPENPEIIFAEQILPQYDSITLGLGEKSALPEYSLLPEAAQDSVEYESSSAYLAITKKGMLHAKRQGSYTLTLTASGGAKAEIPVRVLAAPKSIEIRADRTRIGVSESIFCSAVLPRGSAGSVSFESSKPEILRSNGDGSFTALAAGSAQITASSYNGKTSTLKVKVLPSPETIGVNPETISLGVGDSAVLTAEIPEGSMGGIYFESLQPEIVRCTPSGEITALQLGTAAIRVRALNSGAQADCIVSVLLGAEELYLPETSIDLFLGESRLLEYALLPEGCWTAVNLESADPSIAAIDASGRIRGEKAGTTRIFLRCSNGLYAEAEVRVLDAPKWIRLNPDHLNLASGESYTLSCEFPEYTYSAVSYTSSNPEVASVDPDSGEVLAVSTGTAVISAVSLNGKTDSCTVNVNMDADFVPSPDDFEIIFMDIGRNDGILIRCGDEYAFIDSGYHKYGEKAVEFMKKKGVTKLKYYIGSHAHKDHIGGAGPILTAFPTEMIVVPHKYCMEAMLEFCKTDAERAAVKNTPAKIFTVGQQIYLGSAKITCLGPVNYHYYHYSLKEENGNSLVARITYGENSFLMTGDATKQELAEIEAHNPGCLQSDLFKNPHHDAYVPLNVSKKIRPKITVFSTSNSAWPDKSYIDELRGMGSDVYSTAPGRNGNVKVKSDGSSITVIPQRGEAFKGYSKK